MAQFNTFDQEQQIMSCWNVVDDIDTLYEGVLEHELSKDEIANALLGIKTLYSIRFEKLFSMHEALIREYGHLQNSKKQQLEPTNSWPFPHLDTTNNENDTETPMNWPFPPPTA